jgi:ribosomal protein S17E
MKKNLKAIKKDIIKKSEKIIDKIKDELTDDNHHNLSLSDIDEYIAHIDDDIDIDVPLDYFSV